MAPRLVVELDDSSHQTKKGRERDELVDSVFGAAELPILHVPCNQNYDCDQLGQQISDLAGVGIWWWNGRCWRTCDASEQARC